ncbi:MAG: hypothetical protein ACYTGW_08870 [Planctomycetota bacterium]|jgi:hypothetical protein
MSSRMFASALGAVLLLTSAASTQKLEFPLEYQKHPQRNMGYVPMGSATMRLVSECPTGEYTLPEFTGQHPLFSTLKLGESEFLVVLDLQKEDDRFPSRLFLDRNGNRDLTDDPVLNGRVHFYGDNRCITSFTDGCDVEFQLDGKRLPYSVRFSLRGHNLEEFSLSKLAKQPSKFAVLAVRNRCFYKSSLELDGKKYRVVLGDSNCNGSFVDKASVDARVVSADTGPFYLRGDTFFLTDKKKLTRRDGFTLGGRLLVGDDLFDVEIDTAAGKLTLNTVVEKRLPLKLSHAPERLLVQTDGSPQGVMMFRPGPVARLPSGRYRLLKYELFEEGEDGDLWHLAAAATKDSPFVKLGEGSEATLPFGEPFVHFARVPSYYTKTFRRNPQNGVRLSFVIEGRGKELVSDLALVSGSPRSIKMSRTKKTRPLEPSYAIVKSSGEQVESGSFEWG